MACMASPEIAEDALDVVIVSRAKKVFRASLAAWKSCSPARRVAARELATSPQISTCGARKKLMRTECDKSLAFSRSK
jgi:hypothetical protein